MRNGDHRRGVRASALWGSGKRRTALLAALALVVLVPLGAAATPSKAGGPSAFVTPTLLTSAQSNATANFDVIVQGKGGNQAAKAIADVLGVSKKTYKDFRSIDGVAVQLSGAQLLALAADKHITAITPDARVRLSSTSLPTQLWRYVTGTAWMNTAPGATIAIVDSGIDASRPELAGRIAANVNLSTLPGNSPGDGRGHGTFVAGIAAGRLAGMNGASPNAKIVSLDVMDDQGMARTSDVIAAADWILANKAQYGIEVANFSLHSSVANSFMYDPLDKAVERLWFNGVTVVVAAGNYGTGNGPSGVPYAPGNDPFVITVGAADTGTYISARDDFMAPWSAYGYTLDGFAKPEIAAPGRYMVGPVPQSATLYSERPDHVVADGYMELSGTSFAAPVVSGVASLILARYPSLTPDQVKGAIMRGALRLPNAAPLSAGAGEVNVSRAFSYASRAPVANRALTKFVISDPTTGAPVFDAASWASAAKADASWASASWDSASWDSASWDSASWAEASWSDASWASASWDSSSSASASWADMSLGAASWADNADGESADLNGGAIDPGELTGVLSGTLTP
jgi:serine protease AprX